MTARLSVSTPRKSYPLPETPVGGTFIVCPATPMHLTAVHAAARSKSMRVTCHRVKDRLMVRRIA